MSGTLFEGIERWAERKATITHEDTKTRAHAAIGMLRDHGIQHVRTHVDVTDPTLAALKAMLEVKDEARGLIDLQIVAFPQEGIESFDGGRALMEQAIDPGADVVGGIPHFENTREQGVSSIRFLMDLAELPAASSTCIATKRTIRIRASSKCSRKRRACAGWGRA